MYNIEDQGWVMLDPVNSLHVQVATVTLTTNGNQLQVLMKVNHDSPSKGDFVLPCSILREDQEVEEAGVELAAQYEVHGMKLEQSSTFSFPRIDPRSRVMTVALVGAVPAARLEWVAQSKELALIEISMEGGVAVLS